MCLSNCTCLAVDSEVSCGCWGKEQADGIADAGGTVAAAEAVAGIPDESCTVSATASAMDNAAM